MAEIIHELPIFASPSRIYSALTSSDSVSQWWLPNSRVGAHEGDLGVFPLSDGNTKITVRILELEPDKKVLWKCLEHKFPEWTGTVIGFEISRINDSESLLRFTHSGWRDNSGVFGRTSFYWAALYLRNLKSSLEKSVKLATQLNVPVATAFNAVADGKIFALTGALSSSFNFVEGGSFHLNFGPRGSISGHFNTINRPNLVDLTWNVQGFGRPDEATNVCLRCSQVDAEQSELEVVHDRIGSSESLNAKTSAWSEILQKLSAAFAG